MTGLLLALLAAPVLGATVAFVLPHRAAGDCQLVAAGVAVGWVVIAAQDGAVRWGDLVTDPLLAAATAGTAILVAATRPHSATAAGAALLALTVLPAAAALDPARLPDRRLAAGIVLVAILAAVRLWSERAPRLGQVLALLAGIVIATGLVGADPAEALALSVAGTTVAVVAAAVWGAPGRLLIPAGLLAVSRAAPLREAVEGTDWALVVVAALAAVAAAVLHTTRARPVTERLPLAAVVVGAALLAVDVSSLRSAGALLGAGAVLALAGRHPLALLALVPGTIAAVDGLGLADQIEHAAVGVAAVAVVAAGAAGTAGTLAPVEARARFGPLAALALLFGVVPAWGWTGAELDGYRTALAVAVAVGLPVLLLSRLPASGGRRRGGSIVVRPDLGFSHGTARHLEPVPEASEQAGAQAP